MLSQVGGSYARQRSGLTYRVTDAHNVSTHVKKNNSKKHL
jgi:hypothetical protein